MELGSWKTRLQQCQSSAVQVAWPGLATSPPTVPVVPGVLAVTRIAEVVPYCKKCFVLSCGDLLHSGFPRTLECFYRCAREGKSYQCFVVQGSGTKWLASTARKLSTLLEKFRAHPDSSPEARTSVIVSSHSQVGQPGESWRVSRPQRASLRRLRTRISFAGREGGLGSNYCLKGVFCGVLLARHGGAEPRTPSVSWE
eukprot:896149-Rhodomonas_salina.1